MKYFISRTDSRNPKHNVIVLRRPKLVHISALLRSNSGAVPLAEKTYRLFLRNGQVREGRTDVDGFVNESGLTPGDYEMEIEGAAGRFIVPTTPVHVCRRPIRLPGHILFEPDEESAEEELPSDFDSDEEFFNPVDEREPDGQEWEDVDEFIVGEEEDV